MQVTMETVLSIIGIVQVVTGAMCWYVGLQLKLLRAELVSKDKCRERHERLEEELRTMSTALLTKG